MAMTPRSFDTASKGRPQMRLRRTQIPQITKIPHVMRDQFALMHGNRLLCMSRVRKCENKTVSTSKRYSHPIGVAPEITRKLYSSQEPIITSLLRMYYTYYVIQSCAAAHDDTNGLGRR